MGKDVEKDNEDPMQSEEDVKMLVVGIGASAGGIKALKTFFANVPKDSGNVYVVILHLSPKYESQLAQVLQTASAMPVKQVGDRKMKIGPNCVFVIPPNRSLTIADGYLAAKAISSKEERRAPVDLFFRALAEAHKNRAVGIVLTGTGPNGSMGIKRIKEMGGIVVAQDPEQAEYVDMPQNSIATGLVDYVLPVEEIPAKVKEYGDRLNGNEPRETVELAADLDERALAEIFVILRNRTGHDFANYKRATVLRRINRRMNVGAKETLTEYVELLRNDQFETQSLLKDLLISVTNFFRDHKAWETLEREIIPSICAGKKDHDAVRIWVAGCATGEEAYSMAMLFSEFLMDKIDAPSIQIFATDIDENAIARARSGLYSESDVADVSPERLRHFFVREGAHYRVRRELRERVLFAVHNITKDAPFSRLDLASCRNLLIYLSRPAQVRVLETLHFALKPGGYLFLGTSESASTGENLFITSDKESRIYESLPIASRYPLQTHDISQTIPSEPRNDLHADPSKQGEMSTTQRLTYTLLHQNLLEAYAPPSVVINSDYEIVHLSRNAGRYLQIGGGEPSKNLLEIVRPELRLELRSALYQADQRSAAVTATGLIVKTDSGNETIDLIVRPVVDKGDPDRGFNLVIFAPSLEPPREIPEALIADEPIARHLEDELVRTRSQLRETVEQYEIKHEELKASNEELQSTIEELRSATEEIETGKEELQSSNEELSTLNQELKIKIEELSQSNNDLHNLINSTTVATIFLDGRLRVKLFTQTATRIFNLIPSDLGRPLSDLKSKLQDMDIFDLAGRVLSDLQPFEKEIEAEPDVWYLMRIVPYRVSEEKIDGVVLTFLDISSRLKMEADLKRSQSRLTRAINIDTVGIVFFDNDLKFVDCNETFLKMTGFDRADITSRRFDWHDVTPPEWQHITKHSIAELRKNGFVTPYEKEYLKRDGSRFFGLFASARVGENEIVEYVIDISSRKDAENDLLFKSRLLEAVEQSIIATDIDGNVIYWNGAAERLFGWKGEEAIGRNIVHLNTPKTSVQEANQIMDALSKGKSWNGEFEVIRKDGSTILAHVYNSPILDDTGKVVGIVGVSTDVGERRRTESTLRDTQDRMRILIESVTDYAIFTLSEEGVVTSWNSGAEAIFGYTEDEITGRLGEIIFTDEDRERGVPEKEMQRARKSGRAEDERWHLRKNGTRFFATGVMQPLRSGAAAGYVKICRDQTNILEARTAVRERRTLRSIVRTQEDERQRIARDLHDHLGQQLTALRLKIEGLKANYGAEPAMMKALDDVQVQAKKIDDDVSFMSWELRPTALDNLGLRNALGNFVNEWSKNYGIEAEFHSSRGRRIRLEPDIEINLYRVAQEALNNVFKHAKASKVDVMLEFSKDRVVLVIEDNGVGFSQKAVSQGKKKGHLGLVGMQERAALLGGKLEIETARSKGTTVIARVPMRKVQTERKKID